MNKKSDGREFLIDVLELLKNRIVEINNSIAEGEKESAILRAEAHRESKIRMAEGDAEALLKIKKAEAEGIKLLKEAKADATVLTLKSYEALAKVADGSSTKIIIPSEMQGIASFGTVLNEMLEKKDTKK